MMNTKQRKNNYCNHRLKRIWGGITLRAMCAFCFLLFFTTVVYAFKFIITTVIFLDFVRLLFFFYQYISNHKTPSLSSVFRFLVLPALIILSSSTANNI